MASRRPIWPWVIGAVAVTWLVAGIGLYRYLFVPYAPGTRYQLWTVTVTSGSRTESQVGQGAGRCGDEGPNGASSAKEGPLMRGCFAVGMCSGDTVCDCTSRAHVETRCENGELEGPSRIGDLMGRAIVVPIH